MVKKIAAFWNQLTSRYKTSESVIWPTNYLTKKIGPIDGEIVQEGSHLSPIPALSVLKIQYSPNMGLNFQKLIRWWFRGSHHLTRAGRSGCLVEEDPSKVIFHLLKTGMALWYMVLADHVKVLIKAAVNKDPTALKIRRVEGSSWSVIQTSGDVSLEEPSIPSFTPKVFSSYRIFI